MLTGSEVMEIRGSQTSGRDAAVPSSKSKMEIALLTGCQDRPYAFGLAMALAAKEVGVNVIGGDEVDSPEFHATPNLKFLNLGGRQELPSVLKKLWRLTKYYGGLIRYAAAAKPKVLHILWHNKFEYFDRTLLLFYYKGLGKKLAFTAHNVNQARRDANDSALNRLTLRIQYRLVDHIFVHTNKMKAELLEQFDVRDAAVTVIRHPINDAFPDTGITPADAKQRLGLKEKEKAILFFGRIRPYKGLELLLAAFHELIARDENFRLIVAGESKKGSEEYLDQVTRLIGAFPPGQILSRIQFIPDEDMEIYLKAADVMVLPYKEIFQSGVLFLGYTYGLPVVATDVGSFREEIVEGQTGFLCKPDDPLALAQAIDTYFASDLYKNLTTRRGDIRDYADRHHSWSAVAELTRSAYAQLLERHPA
jgi:D-inositol-3-phosphate glycosyltransferase